MTLSDHLLECHFTTPGGNEPRPPFANTRTFSTKRPGLAWKSFPDQPTTAVKRPVAVLAQFKALARKFDVLIYEVPPQTGTQPGRLLSRALHRYSDANSGLVDGALFGFAHNGTVPVLILLIELHRQNPDSELEWRYAFARMCSARVTAHLGDNLVYEVPAMGRAPGRTGTEGGHTTWRVASANPPRRDR